MKRRETKYLVALMLSLTGCGPGNVIIPGAKVVTVDSSSPLGSQIAGLDASARAFQNRKRFTLGLQAYEKKLGSSCVDMQFVSLVEPGHRRWTGSIEYTMNGESQTCGRKRYETIISFRDAAATVASDFEVVTVLE